MIGELAATKTWALVGMKSSSLTPKHPERPHVSSNSRKEDAREGQRVSAGTASRLLVANERVKTTAQEVIKVHIWIEEEKRLNL